MVDPTPSDYNLTYLRERWERDRSSRIFLQLAEEYRRRGLHSEAIEVLETGLGFHPGYLAAQVALGRCRLEAGQPEAAIKVLERVLSHDPTQAVATRLLAESWLHLGDEDRAQAGIDRCRLIGIPPSELVSLEQRLAIARRASRDRWPAEPPPSLTVPSPPEPVKASTPPEDGLAAAAAPAPAAPELAEPPPPPAVAASYSAVPPAVVAAAVGPPPVRSAAAGDDVFRLPAAPRGVVLPLRPSADRRLVGARSAAPFGAIERARPQATHAAGGAEIFRLLPPPAPAAAAAPASSPAPPAELHQPPALVPQPLPSPPAAAAAPPPVAPQPAPPPGAEPPPPAAAAASARWWERPVERVEEPVAAAAPPPPVAPARIAPAFAAPAAASASTAQPAAREVAPVTPPPAAAASPPPGSPPPPIAPAARSPLANTAGVELQPSGSLAIPELRPSDPGTATLGELYLRQGYVREAEEIFKQVLARDADNEAALSGLEAIGRRRAQKLTAAELLSGGEDREVRGLTARKIQLLTRYLRTLRSGIAPDGSGIAPGGSGNAPEGGGAGTDVPGTAQ